VSANWLVSADSASSYSASMVNFIWFTDEKNVHRVSTATWRHKIGCLTIQNLIHLVSRVC